MALTRSSLVFHNGGQVVHAGQGHPRGDSQESSLFVVSVVAGAPLPSLLHPYPSHCAADEYCGGFSHH